MFRSIECSGLLWPRRPTESMHGLCPVLYKCGHGLRTLVVGRAIYTVQVY